MVKMGTFVRFRQSVYACLLIAVFCFLPANISVAHYDYSQIDSLINQAQHEVAIEKKMRELLGGSTRAWVGKFDQAISKDAGDGVYFGKQASQVFGQFVQKLVGEFPSDLTKSLNAYLAYLKGIEDLQREAAKTGGAIYIKGMWSMPFELQQGISNFLANMLIMFQNVQLSFSVPPAGVDKTQWLAFIGQSGNYFNLLKDLSGKIELTPAILAALQSNNMSAVFEELFKQEGIKAYLESTLKESGKSKADFLVSAMERMMKQSLATQEATKIALTGNVTAVQQQINTNIIQVLANIPEDDPIKAPIIDTTAAIDAIASDIQTADANVADANNQIADLQNDIPKVQETIAQYQQDIKDVDGQITDVQNYISNGTTSLTTFMSSMFPGVSPELDALIQSFMSLLGEGEEKEFEVLAPGREFIKGDLIFEKLTIRAGEEEGAAAWQKELRDMELKREKELGREMGPKDRQDLAKEIEEKLQKGDWKGKGWEYMALVRKRGLESAAFIKKYNEETKEWQDIMEKRRKELGRNLSPEEARDVHKEMVEKRQKIAMERIFEKMTSLAEAKTSFPEVRATIAKYEGYLGKIQEQIKLIRDALAEGPNDEMEAALAEFLQNEAQVREAIQGQKEYMVSAVKQMFEQMTSLAEAKTGLGKLKKYKSDLGEAIEGQKKWIAQAEEGIVELGEYKKDLAAYKQDLSANSDVLKIKIDRLQMRAVEQVKAANEKKAYDAIVDVFDKNTKSIDELQKEIEIMESQIALSEKIDEDTKAGVKMDKESKDYLSKTDRKAVNQKLASLRGQVSKLEGDNASVIERYSAKLSPELREEIQAKAQQKKEETLWDKGIQKAMEGANRGETRDIESTILSITEAIDYRTKKISDAQSEVNYLKGYLSSIQNQIIARKTNSKDEIRFIQDILAAQLGFDPDGFRDVAAVSASGAVSMQTLFDQILSVGYVKSKQEAIEKSFGKPLSQIKADILAKVQSFLSDNAKLQKEGFDKYLVSLNEQIKSIENTKGQLVDYKNQVVARNEEIKKKEALYAAFEVEQEKAIVLINEKQKALVTKAQVYEDKRKQVMYISDRVAMREELIKGEQEVSYATLTYFKSAIEFQKRELGDQEKTGRMTKTEYEDALYELYEQALYSAGLNSKWSLSDYVMSKEDRRAAPLYTTAITTTGSENARKQAQNLIKQQKLTPEGSKLEWAQRALAYLEKDIAVPLTHVGYRRVYVTDSIESGDYGQEKENAARRQKQALRDQWIITAAQTALQGKASDTEAGKKIAEALSGGSDKDKSSLLKISDEAKNTSEMAKQLRAIMSDPKNAGALEGIFDKAARYMAGDKKVGKELEQEKLKYMAGVQAQSDKIADFYNKFATATANGKGGLFAETHKADFAEIDDLVSNSNSYFVKNALAQQQGLSFDALKKFEADAAGRHYDFYGDLAEAERKGKGGDFLREHAAQWNQIQQEVKNSGSSRLADTYNRGIKHITDTRDLFIARVTTEGQQAAFDPSGNYAASIPKGSEARFDDLGNGKYAYAGRKDILRPDKDGNARIAFIDANENRQKIVSVDSRGNTVSTQVFGADRKLVGTVLPPTVKGSMELSTFIAPDGTKQVQEFYNNPTTGEKGLISTSFYDNAGSFVGKKDVPIQVGDKMLSTFTNADGSKQAQFVGTDGKLAYTQFLDPKGKPLGREENYVDAVTGAPKIRFINPDESWNEKFAGKDGVVSTRHFDKHNNLVGTERPLTTPSGSYYDAASEFIDAKGNKEIRHYSGGKLASTEVYKNVPITGPEGARREQQLSHTVVPLNDGGAQIFLPDGGQQRFDAGNRLTQSLGSDGTLKKYDHLPNGTTAETTFGADRKTPKQELVMDSLGNVLKGTNFDAAGKKIGTFSQVTLPGSLTGAIQQSMLPGFLTQPSALSGLLTGRPTQLSTQKDEITGEVLSTTKDVLSGLSHFDQTLPNGDLQSWNTDKNGVISNQDYLAKKDLWMKDLTPQDRATAVLINEHITSQKIGGPGGKPLVQSKNDFIRYQTSQAFGDKFIYDVADYRAGAIMKSRGEEESAKLYTQLLDPDAADENLWKPGESTILDAQGNLVKTSVEQLGRGAVSRNTTVIDKAGVEKHYSTLRSPNLDGGFYVSTQSGLGTRMMITGKNPSIDKKVTFTDANTGVVSSEVTSGGRTLLAVVDKFGKPLSTTETINYPGGRSAKIFYGDLSASSLSLPENMRDTLLEGKVVAVVRTDKNGNQNQTFLVGNDEYDNLADAERQSMELFKTRNVMGVGAEGQWFASTKTNVEKAAKETVKMIATGVIELGQKGAQQLGVEVKVDARQYISNLAGIEIEKSQSGSYLRDMLTGVSTMAATARDVVKKEGAMTAMFIAKDKAVDWAENATAADWGAVTGQALVMGATLGSGVSGLGGVGTAVTKAGLKAGSVTARMAATGAKAASGLGKVVTKLDDVAKVLDTRFMVLERPALAQKAASLTSKAQNLNRNAVKAVQEADKAMDLAKKMEVSRSALVREGAVNRLAQAQTLAARADTLTTRAQAAAVKADKAIGKAADAGVAARHLELDKINKIDDLAMRDDALTRVRVSELKDQATALQQRAVIGGKSAHDVAALFGQAKQLTLEAGKIGGKLEDAGLIARGAAYIASKLPGAEGKKQRAEFDATLKAKKWEQLGKAVEDLQWKTPPLQTGKVKTGDLIFDRVGAAPESRVMLQVKSVDATTGALHLDDGRIVKPDEVGGFSKAPKKHEELMKSLKEKLERAQSSERAAGKKVDFIYAEKLPDEVRSRLGMELDKELGAIFDAESGRIYVLKGTSTPQDILHEYIHAKDYLRGRDMEGASVAGIEARTHERAARAGKITGIGKEAEVAAELKSSAAYRAQYGVGSTKWRALEARAEVEVATPLTRPAREEGRAFGSFRDIEEGRRIAEVEVQRPRVEPTAAPEPRVEVAKAREAVEPTGKALPVPELKPAELEKGAVIGEGSNVRVYEVKGDPTKVVKEPKPDALMSAEDTLKTHAELKVALQDKGLTDVLPDTQSVGGALVQEKLTPLPEGEAISPRIKAAAEAARKQGINLEVKPENIGVRTLPDGTQQQVFMDVDDSTQMLSNMMKRKLGDDIVPAGRRKQVEPPSQSTSLEAGDVIATKDGRIVAEVLPEARLGEAAKIKVAFKILDESGEVVSEIPEVVHRKLADGFFTHPDFEVIKKSSGVDKIHPDYLKARKMEGVGEYTIEGKTVLMRDEDFLSKNIVTPKDGPLKGRQVTVAVDQNGKGVYVPLDHPSIVRARVKKGPPKTQDQMFESAMRGELGPEVKEAAIKRMAERDAARARLNEEISGMQAKVAPEPAVQVGMARRQVEPSGKPLETPARTPEGAIPSRAPSAADEITAQIDTHYDAKLGQARVDAENKVRGVSAEFKTKLDDVQAKAAEEAQAINNKYNDQLAQFATSKDKKLAQKLIEQRRQRDLAQLGEKTKLTEGLIKDQRTRALAEVKKKYDTTKDLFEAQRKTAKVTPYDDLVKKGIVAEKPTVPLERLTPEEMLAKAKKGGVPIVDPYFKAYTGPIPEKYLAQPPKLEVSGKPFVPGKDIDLGKLEPDEVTDLYTRLRAREKFSQRLDEFGETISKQERALRDDVQSMIQKRAKDALDRPDARTFETKVEPKKGRAFATFRDIEPEAKAPTARERVFFRDKARGNVFEVLGKRTREDGSTIYVLKDKEGKTLQAPTSVIRGRFEAASQAEVGRFLEPSKRDVVSEALDLQRQGKNKDDIYKALYHQEMREQKVPKVSSEEDVVRLISPLDPDKATDVVSYGKQKIWSTEIAGKSVDVTLDAKAGFQYVDFPDAQKILPDGSPDMWKVYVSPGLADTKEVFGKVLQRASKNGGVGKVKIAIHPDDLTRVDKIVAYVHKDHLKGFVDDLYKDLKGVKKGESPSFASVYKGLDGKGPDSIVSYMQGEQALIPDSDSLMPGQTRPLIGKGVPMSARSYRARVLAETIDEARKKGLSGTEADNFIAQQLRKKFHLDKDNMHIVAGHQDPVYGVPATKGRAFATFRDVGTEGEKFFPKDLKSPRVYKGKRMGSVYPTLGRLVLDKEGEVHMITAVVEKDIAALEGKAQPGIWMKNQKTGALTKAWGENVRNYTLLPREGDELRRAAQEVTTKTISREPQKTWWVSFKEKLGIKTEVAVGSAVSVGMLIGARTLMKDELKAGESIYQVSNIDRDTGFVSGQKYTMNIWGQIEASQFKMPQHKLNAYMGSDELKNLGGVAAVKKIISSAPEKIRVPEKGKTPEYVWLQVDKDRGGWINTADVKEGAEKDKNVRVHLVDGGFIEISRPRAQQGIEVSLDETQKWADARRDVDRLIIKDKTPDYVKVPGGWIKPSDLAGILRYEAIDRVVIYDAPEGDKVDLMNALAALDAVKMATVKAIPNRLDIDDVQVGQVIENKDGKIFQVVDVDADYGFSVLGKDGKTLKIDPSDVSIFKPAGLFVKDKTPTFVQVKNGWIQSLDVSTAVKQSSQLGALWDKAKVSVYDTPGGKVVGNVNTLVASDAVKEATERAVPGRLDIGDAQVGQVIEDKKGSLFEVIYIDDDDELFVTDTRGKTSKVHRRDISLFKPSDSNVVFPYTPKYKVGDTVQIPELEQGKAVCTVASLVKAQEGAAYSVECSSAAAAGKKVIERIPAKQMDYMNLKKIPRKN